MPDINNSLAAQVNTSPVDLSKTLGTISQIELAQAHAGLFGLQAQQEARKLAGFDYLKSNPTDYQGAIQRGLDPSVGSTLQTMSEKDRAMGITPGGVSPESYNSLTSAQEHRAKTAQTGVETDTKAMENKSRIAQGYLANPTDSSWNTAIDSAISNGYVDRLNGERIKAVKDPAQRAQAAQAWIGSGVAPNDYTKPHNVSPTDAITTPGAMMRPPVASSNRVVGDKEAVQSGLYEPSPQEQAQGWVRPPPTSRVEQTFGQVAPVLTPRQAKAEEGAGAADAKYTEGVTTAARDARAANYTLSNLQRDAASLPMGRGMATAAEGRAWLQSAYDNNVMGAHSWMPDPGKDATAAYDSMLKNSGQLTRQALMQTHERAAIAYDMIQKQLPNISTSKGGFARVAAEWQGLNDDAIYKSRAMANQPVAGRGDKFEADWNKNVNPVGFMLNRMAPEERKQVIQGLSTTKEGRSALEDIQKTATYLHENGVE